jgi:hypothetical protein
MGYDVCHASFDTQASCSGSLRLHRFLFVPALLKGDQWSATVHRAAKPGQASLQVPHVDRLRLQVHVVPMMCAALVAICGLKVWRIRRTIWLDVRLLD